MRVRVAPLAVMEVAMKNAIALIIVLAVLIGGGFALYKFDDGRAHRTDPSISRSAASD
ncbi:hypothetical protein ACVILL_003391 [Bradyrhizobium sp. USDA 3364]